MNKAQKNPFELMRRMSTEKPFEMMRRIFPCLLVISILFPTLASAQKEVTSEILRYRGREKSTMSYERYEYKPRLYQPFIKREIPREELITLAPTAERVRHRTYLADSHYGLKFYEFKTCVECHPHQAGNLHSVRYRITCRQCHGEDPIPGNKHYYSSMNPRRRYAFVCAKCHTGSSYSYGKFLIHEPSPAAITTRDGFPMLFYAFWMMIAIAGGTFLVFLPHTLLWGIRELKGLTPKKGGPKRIRRFTLGQRLFHLLLMVSFLIQASTGLARLFSGTAMGNYLMMVFGGFGTVIIIHKWVGIFMLALFGVHIFYVLMRIDWRGFPKNLLGPDSLLPRPEDLRQAIQHVGWLLGRNKPPSFDRWGYWEKFDYWAVFWGMFIIGGTGIMLFEPTLTSLFLPGWALNVALWVHRLEAILAMAHVFIIHFFIGHLRPHNFPMDLAMFQGSVDLNSAEHEKPRWIERLQRENRLDSLLEPGPSVGRRIVFYLLGYTAIAAGTLLLVGGLITAVSMWS